MITPETAVKRLETIAAHAAAGNFEVAEAQAKVLAEDVNRASRPAYPTFKPGRGGQGPAWDAHHQLYAAALPHVRSLLVRAAHADAAGVAEAIGKARAALAPTTAP